MLHDEVKIIGLRVTPEGRITNLPHGAQSEHSYYKAVSGQFLSAFATTNFEGEINKVRINFYDPAELEEYAFIFGGDETFCEDIILSLYSDEGLECIENRGNFIISSGRGEISVKAEGTTLEASSSERNKIPATGKERADYIKGILFHFEIAARVDAPEK